VTESESWQQLARGEKLPEDVPRRLRLFAHTFATILQTGTTRSVPATSGLVATERHTKERGAIVFVTNPTSETVTGSVFPALPEITLAPFETFAFVHDTPIGNSGRYLDAYAGIVKSEASVLTAHIRSDPHPGARVYVYAPIGTMREVVLFNAGERGQGATLSFTEVPQIIPVGISQIVALPDTLADCVWWEAEFAAEGGTLHFETPTAAVLRYETVLVATHDETPPECVFIPDGACYLQEITHWRCDAPL
jgi:hypothetical protein